MHSSFDENWENCSPRCFGDVQPQSLLTVTLSKDWRKMRQRFNILAIVFYLTNHEKDFIPKKWDCDFSFNYLKYENRL